MEMFIVITNTGPYPVTEEGIKDITENFDMYWEADNLPKWIYIQSDFTLTKLGVLQVILDHAKTGRLLDVRS